MSRRKPPVPPGTPEPEPAPPGPSDNVLMFPPQPDGSPRQRHPQWEGEDVPRTELPEGPEPEPPAGPEPPSVETLAAQGLTLEEIVARLGLAQPLPARERSALEAAVERGRLLGRAAIKAAQFRAAMQGRVSAQSQVLARLGGDEWQEEDDPETIAVVRRIIPREEGEAGPQGEGA